jgi:uncharacterized protein (TIGR00369 family)
MDAAQKQQMLAVAERFMRAVPHNAALGIRITDVDAGHMEMELPWDEKLVGNPETLVLHGGVITTLIDGCCGGAVLTKLTEPRRVATLDLRIDYLRPAKPRQNVRAVADCYRVTHHVAFVRAEAFDSDDATDPVATAAGTFALFEPGQKQGEPPKVPA